MGLEADAIEKVFEYGKKSKPRIVKADGEPDFVYYTIDESGTMKKEYAEPRPEQNNAGSIATLLEIAKRKKEDEKSDVEIWLSPSGIVLVYGAGFGGDRRSRTCLDVTFSSQIKRLDQLEKNQNSFDQGSLIKLLRIDLANSIDPAVIESLRRVKFKAAQDHESEIQHGKTSIGKAISSEITGTGVLPPFVDLSIPIFSTPIFSRYRGRIAAALEPNASTSTFQLIPLPGEVQALVHHGEKCIRAEIEEQMVSMGFTLPIYSGVPGSGR